jgi:hypothetical protein
MECTVWSRIRNDVAAFGRKPDDLAVEECGGLPTRRCGENFIL